MNNWV